MNLDGLQTRCAAWMLRGPIQSPLETLTLAEAASGASAVYPLLEVQPVSSAVQEGLLLRRDSKTTLA